MQDLAVNPQVSLQTLERIVGDISLQPLWRAEADRAADYYDDKQFTPAEIDELESRGQPVLIHNLIKPAINSVLGMEAKTRSDWKLLADDDAGLPVVEALNEKLNEAARLARANRACSDAYAAQVKSGLGWVEVKRNADPFGNPYQVNYIHRREMFWDWHSQRPDLSDARWIMRRKWVEADDLMMSFPQHRELIEAISNGWKGFDVFNSDEALMYSEDLMSAYTIQNGGTNLTEDEWYDPDRKRCLVFEVWYRVREMKPVLTLPSGAKFVFDRKDPRHRAAALSGRAEVVMAPVQRMRLAFFAGPHRLVDMDSPHPHNHFPYVPFWGYREDRTNVPYGIIRSMMPAQDEINKRRSRLTWLLNAKLIVVEDDAVTELSDEDLLDRVHSGQGVIRLDSERRHADRKGLDILTDMGVTGQQFQVMQDAEKMIQDVAGIYNAFLGKEGAADSGVAINSLVEQSTTTLAEINDNYRYARQQVGELLLAHIVQDIGDKETTVLTNVNKPRPTKRIVLNERHDDGMRVKINNNVQRTKTQVIVDDIANSPGYRQQMARSLMDMAGQLPKEYQAALIDLIVELSDIPNRDDVLKRIRQVSGQGVNPEDLTDAEREAMERKQKLQQEVETLELEKLRAELQEMQARARELNAKAQHQERLSEDEEAKLEAEIRKLNADTKETVTKIVKLRRELGQAIDAEIAVQQQRMPRLPVSPGAAQQPRGE